MDKILSSIFKFYKCMYVYNSLLYEFWVYSKHLILIVKNNFN